MLTQRIGVIGCGTMGAAILRGLLEARVATAGRLRGALPDASIIIITHKPVMARMADMVVTLADGHARVEQRSEMVDA